MKSRWLLFLGLTMLLLVFSACGDEDDNPLIPDPPGETFTALESPYLICASRNPGGIVFDFEYNGNPGGANAADSLTVSDFTSDLLVRTIKAEKPDGSLQGMPHMCLQSGAQALNFSLLNPDYMGMPGYESLTAEDLVDVGFAADDPSFDLSELPTGETGKPLLAAVQTEFAKLVIGDAWKGPARNDVENDEPVWVIRTAEGRLVKMIVPVFPAHPAPTPTGYIPVVWSFLD